MNPKPIETTVREPGFEPGRPLKGLRILSLARQGVRHTVRLFTGAQASVFLEGSPPPVGASLCTTRAEVRPFWHWFGTDGVERC